MARWYYWCQHCKMLLSQGYACPHCRTSDYVWEGQSSLLACFEKTPQKD